MGGTVDASRLETGTTVRGENAAERSRTSTGVSTHKALKLKTARLLERIPRSRARSNPVVSGCFR